MNGGLHYELSELERLINSVRENIIIDDANSCSFRTSVQTETERIKFSLMQEVFSFGDEHHLERYIQYHQQAIISLMDKVVVSLRHHSGDLFTGDFFQTCYTCLEKLLSYIERHFTKYFDQDAKAPDSYLAIKRKDVSETLGPLAQRLNELKADPKLIDVSLYALRKFVINDSSKQTTYRRIIYVKEVQKEILRLTGQANESIDDELRTMLYYLNYNSIRSFAYHTQLIADLVNSAETHAQKIESLSLHLKKINQAQVKPSVGYNYLAPSLKSQLSNYIIEEIDYLEKLQTLGSDPPAGVVVRKENETRIDFNLSVAQLALFIKTLLECKVIQNQNTTELLKLLARIAVTKKTDWISYDSLRAKFYNVESSTKATVRQLFLDFAAYIERH